MSKERPEPGEVFPADGPMFLPLRLRPGREIRAYFQGWVAAYDLCREHIIDGPRKNSMDLTRDTFERAMFTMPEGDDE
jgi:hypothetical protein